MNLHDQQSERNSRVARANVSLLRAASQPAVPDTPNRLETCWRSEEGAGPLHHHLLLIWRPSHDKQRAFRLLAPKCGTHVLFSIILTALFFRQSAFFALGDQLCLVTVTCIVSLIFSLPLSWSALRTKLIVLEWWTAVIMLDALFCCLVVSRHDFKHGFLPPPHRSRFHVCLCSTFRQSFSHSLARSLDVLGQTVGFNRDNWCQNLIYWK